MAKWLNLKPGGASVALRNVMDEARGEQAEIAIGYAPRRKPHIGFCRLRPAICPDYEDATRALFAYDRGSSRSSLRTGLKTCAASP